ncbi:hypothetical protein Tsubulata_022653 [Turnera subulata]|uniref:Uncharacterized protein n=1 Tax=Turnera subulata TaxID=218843 RepID=A0A9Q0GFX8_9ROSI|nr:hypothetical protein Tsubulata_022653 [Turnera subulata]
MWENKRDLFKRFSSMNLEDKVQSRDGGIVPFSDRLNSLIGPNFTTSSAVKKPSASPSPPIDVLLRRTPAFKYPPTVKVPVLLPQKRPAFEFSRNYSAMAAAAAAADSDSEDEEDEEEVVVVGGAGVGAGARAGRESCEEEEEVVDEGIKRWRGR